MIRGLWPACVTLATLLVTLSPAAGEQELADRLRARGIKDARVLDAFARVRREAFAPPIGHGQTLPQPYLIARMTELLGAGPGDRVLEVGAGSGYPAAILAELAQTVCSVESVPALAADARLRLTRLGYRNVHVKQGDGGRGWREYGPYDRIVVTAAAPRVPRPLIDQLGDGGVLVMPIGAPGERQVLIRGVKRAGVLRAREMGEVASAPKAGAGIRGSARDENERGRPSRLEGDSDEAIDQDRGGSTDEIREESLPPEETLEPKGEHRGTDRRSRPDEAVRAARVRGAPGDDRRCEVSRCGLDAARSRTAVRRCAG